MNLVDANLHSPCYGRDEHHESCQLYVNLTNIYIGNPGALSCLLRGATGTCKRGIQYNMAVTDSLDDRPPLYHRTFTYHPFTHKYR